MSSLATLVESLLLPRQGVILDDRRMPLFKLVRRVREQERSAFWHATVVDEELLAQGAPAEVQLQFMQLPDIAPPLLARALECTLVDHPRIQLVHSAALPAATLLAVQPAEPSPLLPPLHSLPLADETGCIILVKEWVESVPLLSWRQARGSKVKLSDILDLFDTTSEALAALHRRGFAHGSVTPESIGLQEVATPVMAGQDESTVWVAKLLDLGLSRTLALPGTWPSGASALWAAPEAFAPDATTDWRRVDQLSVAALLFALWTDQVPFDAIPAGTRAEEANELRRRQIEALPPPRGNTRARNLGVTPAMSAACMRAMSPEPADRFPSLDAFGAALRQASRENLRKAMRGDVDASSGTQPGTYVGSKFRSLTVPPQLQGMQNTNPGARVIANPAPALNGEVRPRPEPLKVPRGKVPDEKPIASAGPMWSTRAPSSTAGSGSDDEDGPAQSGTVREVVDDEVGDDDDSSLFVGVSGTEPEPDEALTDPPEAVSRVRKTRILTHPEEADGPYPEHPDVPERRETTSPYIDAGGGDRRWAFNNLAAVLLGLWLLTLVAYFLKSPATDPSGAPVAEKSERPAKVEKVGSKKAVAKSMDLELP